MKLFQRTLTFLAGLGFGLLLASVIHKVHYGTATMRYGDGQVLMLLIDTYPDLTVNARNTLIEYLDDGYITLWEYDVILRQATQAVFYDRGDVSMGRHLVRDPC